MEHEIGEGGMAKRQGKATYSGWALSVPLLGLAVLSLSGCANAPAAPVASAGVRGLLGDGQGSFRTPIPIGAVADRSYSGVLVDIDVDGDLDVVVSNDRPDAKLVYLNDGKGDYALGSTFGRHFGGPAPGRELVSVSYAKAACHGP